MWFEISWLEGSGDGWVPLKTRAGEGRISDEGQVKRLWCGHSIVVSVKC